MKAISRIVLCSLLAVSLLACPAIADMHVSGVPQLTSRSNASYTLYLDFAGFNYTGTWSSKTPGNTPALDNTANSGTFTVAQSDRIKEMWARTVQAYAPFNINVTTIDPAVAAGQSGTDFARQAYYETQARMMHTVITTSYAWYGAAGGVSFVGTTKNAYNPASFNGGAGAGNHTNWIFTDGTANKANYTADATVHENGHGLSLLHQSDYSGSTNVNEYSKGDNNSANGTYSPIMGAGYYTQRTTWRKGDSPAGGALHTQNDVKTLLSNTGMGGFVEDGIGHTRQTATPLPLIGSTVDYSLAQGVIVPVSTNNPDPIGVDKYTRDWFSFLSNGTTAITLTANNGDDLITPGVAAPGATLRSTLKIYDSLGALVGTATEAASTMAETFAGLLPAGTYYAEVASYGGHTQTLPNPAGGFFNTTYYYDMGSFFLTGSGFAVPEPMTMLILSLGSLLMIRHRRRAAA